MQNYDWKIIDNFKIPISLINDEFFSFKFFINISLNNIEHLCLEFELQDKPIYFHGILKKTNYLKILDSTYSGFLIPNDSIKYYEINYKKINNLLIKKLKKIKIDQLILKPSPLLTYNLNKLLPKFLYFRGYSDINGFLIIDNLDINKLSYNLRREIKIGQENLKNFEIIDETNIKIEYYLKNLINYPIKQALSHDQINDFILNAKKGYYKIKMVLNIEEIVCVIIFSKLNTVGSQTYNFNNIKYKKLFINKAIHYDTIKEFFNSGLNIFILGDAIDNDPNLTSLTNFKKSFSNKQLIAIQKTIPISLNGSIFIIIKKIYNFFKK